MGRQFSSRARAGRFKSTIGVPSGVGSAAGVAIREIGDAGRQFGAAARQTAKILMDREKRRIGERERVAGVERGATDNTDIPIGDRSVNVPAITFASNPDARREIAIEQNAAVNAFRDRAVADIATKISGFAAESQGDPGKFNALVAEYRRGFTNGIAGEGSQGLRAEVKGRIDRAALPFDRQISQQAKAITSDQQTSALYGAISSLSRQAEEVAAMLSSPVEDTRELGQDLMAELIGDLGRTLGRTGPDGRTLLSPAQADSELSAFNVNVAVGQGIAAYDITPDKNAFVRDLRKNIDPENTMTPEEETKAIARITAHHSRSKALLAGENSGLAREAATMVEMKSQGIEVENEAEVRTRLATASLTSALRRVEEVDKESAGLRQALAGTEAEFQKRMEGMQGAVDTTSGFRRFMIFSKARETRNRNLAVRPYQYMADLGFIPRSAAAPVDISKPETLDRRIRLRAVIAAQTGRPIAILEKREAKAIETFLDQNPENAVAVFSAIAPYSLSDRREIARSIGADKPAYGIAIQIAGQQPAVAQDIIRGERLRAADAGSIDAKTLREEFADMAGNLFAGEADPSGMARVAYEKTALNLYTVHKGRNPDSSDDDLMRDASRLALGGGYAADGSIVGGPIEYRGRKIIPPTLGMERDEFIGLLQRLNARDLIRYGNGFPSDGKGRFTAAGEIAKGNYFLETVGDGLYRVGNRTGFLSSQQISDEGRRIQDEGAPAQRPSSPYYMIDLGQFARDGGGSRPLAVSPRSRLEQVQQSR